MTDILPDSLSAPADGVDAAGPCVMVIFGATGDLTKRKLLPALHNLATARLLGKPFAIVALGRNPISTEEFVAKLRADALEHLGPAGQPEVIDRLVGGVEYLSGDLADAQVFSRLQETLVDVDKRHQTRGNWLFYLAVPPSYFATIVEGLGRERLVGEARGWRRVVIEKPFGRDLDSARQLNIAVRSVLGEHQIYRIDHYLGKETVQNLLVFRFANGIFEPIWNRRYIDHVQITVAEELGVEHRGAYYEEAGALRDMIPNHLFQLLALTAMEPPTSFDADAVRNEKAKVLGALRPIPPREVLANAVRGQYGDGVIDGESVQAYRSEARVTPESTTDTYAALKLTIDNWRWAGVPFYMRTGKRLPGRVSEIAIRFKKAPYMMFKATPVDHLGANELVCRIQPREGMALSFGAKVPGTLLRLGNVDMDFCYADYFKGKPSTGYETLLYDAMTGDATLFQRGDNVEAAWQVVTPVIDVWQALPPRKFPNYAAGSNGPAEADELLERDGRRWRSID